MILSAIVHHHENPVFCLLAIHYRTILIHQHETRLQQYTIRRPGVPASCCSVITSLLFTSSASLNMSALILLVIMMACQDDWVPKTEFWPGRSQSQGPDPRPMKSQRPGLNPWSMRSQRPGPDPQHHNPLNLFNYHFIIYKFTNLQIYKSTNLQIYKSTNLQFYNSTLLQIYNSTNLQI